MAKQDKATGGTAVADAPKPTTEVTEAVVTTPVIKEAKQVVDTDIKALGDHNMIRNRQNRQTGARIQLYSPIAPGNTWVVKCVTHEQYAHFQTRKAAKAVCYTPASFCTGCQEVLKAKQDAAAAALAANTAKAAETPAVKPAK